MKKKLIEVALPLDDINAASAREKFIHKGHPSTLHLWWARRPLAAARAVTFASLVDDPSSHPDQFPTEADQAKERERLFGIIRDLVVWENSNNENVIAKAKAEIMKSTDNNPPAFLDPFAGGGALPLEAQRLGLRTYACDLNPVAVMINKAMVEIPAKYQKLPPINPEHRNDCDSWDRCTGMASDVEYYGKMLKQKAFEKIGHLYPTAKVKENGIERDAMVLVWLWSRTMQCQNPACGKEIPLLRSFDISRKKGNEHHVEIGNDGIRVVKGTSHRTGGTISRTGAICPYCGQPIELDTIRNYGTRKGFGSSLLSIIAERSDGRKMYLSPSPEHVRISLSVPKPKNEFSEKLPDDVRHFSPPLYGLPKYSDLFTNRQLTMLTTLIDLLDEIEKNVESDITDHEKYNGYAAAIRTYLAFSIDKMADFSSSFCSWNYINQEMGHIFGRQAIPMIWDYAEANPFASSTGSYEETVLKYMVNAISQLPSSDVVGQVAQWDATQDNALREIMVSTDPPYYDNIGYADLSDFFYIWMRRSLQKTYPKMFSTILTPKNPELVALPHRFDGSKLKAKEFFEDGMSQTCKNLFLYSREDIPVTIYYAFKQTEMDDDEEKTSSGWETMLAAIINSGFAITGTWPMSTERSVRLISVGTNALSSSIIIVCRKTKTKLPSITMRQFLDILKAETIPALRRLQAANIAPVDLAQSSIGPGIAVFSRYEAIIKSDGSKLSVREALKLINHELDSHLTASIGSTDSETSYCLSLYTQRAFNDLPFGEAQVLANAKNIIVEDLSKIGVLDSAKGKVNLRVREDIPKFDDDSENCLWLVTQQVVHAFETSGYTGVAEIFSSISEGTIEKIKSLCYQLFSIADGKGWTQEALAYNAMITTWDSTVSAARDIKTNKKVTQLELF